MQHNKAIYTLIRWVCLLILLCHPITASAQLTSRIDCFFPAAWNGKETKLIIKPLNQSTIIDTAFIEKRHAIFTVNLPDLSSAYIWIEGNQDDVHFLIDSPQIDLAFDPHAAVPIVISGSSSSDVWLQQRQLLAQIVESNADMRLSFPHSPTSDEFLIAYMKQADSLHVAYQQTLAKMIEEHPSLPSSWFLFASYYHDFSYATTRRLFTQFSSFSSYPSYQNIAKELAEKQVGKRAIDFTVPNLAGDSITLSKLNNRYILLDFSSPHLTTCQQRHTELKEIYKRYHSLGLEILTISCEFTKQAGDYATKQENLPWLVAVTVMGASNALKAYTIDRVPDNVLMDANKLIIGRDMSSQELDSTLNELVKK